jgi:cbb3-type cytochrome c oxidase subunit II
MKMTFKIILWGGLAVFFAVATVAVFTPVAVWNPPTTLIAHVYTPEQELGRTLFLSNGCNYCHTQYVRTVDNAMGPVSEGGNYNYDNPMILGSERTGPDLSYIGRKRSVQWEIDHMVNPRKYSPLSIMPNFTYLTPSQANAIAQYLFFLGDRNAAEFMVQAPVAYQDTAPLANSAIQVAQSTDPSAPPQGWPTFKASGLYDGKMIYAARCMTCHGCAGNGLGTYGGTLIVTPANFKQDPFKTMSDDEWFWHVSEGIQGSVMPPWKESLTPDQIKKVIAYIQNVYAAPFERDPNEGDPPAMYDRKDPLPVTVDNIDAGKRIWTRECAVCHGDAARGEGIYGKGIIPVPPSFDSPDDYNTYTDADYFWRISEGVPWTAMPTWKVVYPSTTQRWQLVQYIRTMFTQTVPAPPAPKVKFTMTKVERDSTIPKGLTYDAGRQQFLVMCSHCHGLAGDGKGWAGDYLHPAPASLQTSLAASVPNIKDHFDGTTFAKVTNGIRDSAMPTWGEFLNIRMRWQDVKYLKDSYLVGLPAESNRSHYNDGKVPIDYVRTDPGIFQSEIATIVPGDGKPIYEQFCVTCHGTDGKGNGPGVQHLAGGGPAPMAQGMAPSYIFATVRKGLHDTHMYGFQPLLDETQIWDVTAYVTNLTGGKWGD